MSKTLSGKTALVTGGSRGIGAAIARALAEQGADVAISYTASAEAAAAIVSELERSGVKAAAFQADQADPAQAAKLVTDVVADFGKLDILVNNAGVIAVGPVTADDTAALDRVHQINTAGVIATIRAAAPVISDNGRIVSLSSGLATRIGTSGLADYAASKAAIDGYSRGVARDLGPRGVTVNVIQSGPVNTDMNPDDGPFADFLKGLAALGRYAQPEEIASAAVFLASPGASYITGSVLTVDGGCNA